MKQEPSITTLIDPDADAFDRERNIIQSVRERRKFDSNGKTQRKKKRKQELDNIKDPDVKRELRQGSKLISYSEA